MIFNPEIESQLRKKVEDGLYPSESLALEEAIRLLNKKDEFINYINSSITEAEEDIISNRLFSELEVKEKLLDFKKSFQE